MTRLKDRPINVPWNTDWKRYSSYELITVNNVRLIRACSGAGSESYNPLELSSDKQPHLSAGRHDGQSPIQDLANLLRVDVAGLAPIQAVRVLEGSRLAPDLDLRTQRKVIARIEERALAFVNRWGLLGLWAVERWKGWQPIGTSIKWGAKDPDGDSEPLGLLVEAALRFSLLAESVAVYRSLDDHASIELLSKICNGFHSTELPHVDDPIGFEVDGLDEVLREGARPRRVIVTGKPVRGWQYPCLWVACHIALDFLLDDPREEIRQCKRERCGRLFATDNPQRLYCTAACEKAQRLWNSRH